MPLSLILIVKNEERDLPACLESARGLADEIIVVDTGSTDGTKAVAAGFSAKVFDDPWADDFSKARNRAIAEAKGPWILWLDADDRLSPESVSAIKRLVLAPPEEAHAFMVENPADGRSGPVFRQVRLFPKREGIYFEGRIHESLTPALKRAGMAIRFSSIIILHTGYDNPEERALKTERNLKLLETEVERHPGEPTVLFALGNSYYQKKDFDRAIRSYLMADGVSGIEKIHPDLYCEIPALVGTAYFEMNRDGEAAQWFKKAVARAPDHITPYYYLGKIALRRNEGDLVLKMFMKVIEIEPEITTIAVDLAGMKTNAYAFAANLLFVRGRFEDALRLFAEADAKFPSVAFSYGTAAHAALRCRDIAKALYFFGKGEALNDLTSMEWSDYGALRWERGDRPGAINCFEQAMIADGANLTALDNYADAVENEKDIQRGCDFLKALIQKGADGPGIALMVNRWMTK